MLHWLDKLPRAWRGAAVRLGFNLHPSFRRTGGRVVRASHDLRFMRVRLSLTWSTRNVLGSLHGGALFSITDGPHPIMLMSNLGRDYIVWDKFAAIRYRKPGYTALYADFVIDEAELQAIRAALETQPDLERVYSIDIKDRHGTVYATVERTVYISNKTHYRQKTGTGDKT
ncbi:MAG TPA: DUF4442 domain-containing protein [Macromonas sp.]|nr:DUF4442 domain-containing protein [Macromonas sp.]